LRVLGAVNSTDSLNSTLLGKKDWVADLTFTRRACACVLLVNVQHVKVVPDARQILRTLLRGGLDSREPIRELRDLNRNGAILVQQRGTVSNRIEKVLEAANIKVASVGRVPLGSPVAARPACPSARCGRRALEADVVVMSEIER
jgi:hypothetical protein